MSTWVIPIDGRPLPAIAADRVGPPALRPSYAELTVQGAKTMELRTTGCTMQPGDRALVYATRPIAALIGEAVVHAVVPRSVGVLTRTKYLPRHHVADGALLAYARGAVGLTCIDWLDQSARRYRDPIPLARLRELGYCPQARWVRAKPPIIAAADEAMRERTRLLWLPRACPGCGDGALVVATRSPQTGVCEHHSPDPTAGCLDCLADARERGVAFAAYEGEFARCSECGYIAEAMFSDGPDGDDLCVWGAVAPPVVERHAL